MSVEVTKHATDRIRERLGLPKKAAQAEADRAQANGIHISETSGRLRKYLDSLHIYHRNGSDYRVTPSGVFVITDGHLVTVFQVPKHLRNTVMAHWKSREVA